MMVHDIREVFLYELGSLYDIEHTGTEMLLLLRSEAEDESVKSAFEQHERETRQQIQHLKQCFQLLDVAPRRVTSEVIRGLVQDHESFLRETPTPETLTAFDLGAQLKTEQLEIACYRVLIEQAGLLGQTECIGLLRESLQQEEAMARKLEQLGRQIGRQLIPHKRKRAA